MYVEKSRQQPWGTLNENGTLFDISSLMKAGCITKKNIWLEPAYGQTTYTKSTLKATVQHKQCRGHYLNGVLKAKDGVNREKSDLDEVEFAIRGRP